VEELPSAYAHLLAAKLPRGALKEMQTEHMRWYGSQPIYGDFFKVDREVYFFVPDIRPLEAHSMLPLVKALPEHSPENTVAKDGVPKSVARKDYTQTFTLHAHAIGKRRQRTALESTQANRLIPCGTHLGFALFLLFLIGRNRARKPIQKSGFRNAQSSLYGRQG
jgi:hypothetical protein